MTNAESTRSSAASQLVPTGSVRRQGPFDTVDDLDADGLDTALAGEKARQDITLLYAQDFTEMIAQHDARRRDNNLLQTVIKEMLKGSSLLQTLNRRAVTPVLKPEADRNGAA